MVRRIGSLPKFSNSINKGVELKHQFSMRGAILFSLFMMTLAACGGGGGNDTPNPSPNAMPVANAGRSRIVLSGSEVILDGSSSSDSDGQIVSYKWTQSKGSAVTLIDSNTVSARFVTPETEKREELTFQLIVLDNAGDQDADEVPVTINIKPVQ